MKKTGSGDRPWDWSRVLEELEVRLDRRAKHAFATKVFEENLLHTLLQCAQDKKYLEANPHKRTVAFLKKFLDEMRPHFSRQEWTIVLEHIKLQLFTWCSDNTRKHIQELKR